MNRCCSAAMYTIEPMQISVIVLSYNRRDELKITLSEILKQKEVVMEIIVADNASSDGTREMLSADFPQVKVLAFDQNYGTHARRLAASSASAQYLLFYDDDSAPSTPQDVSRIVAFFEWHPEAAALCTNIYRTRSNFYETWGWERYAVSETSDGAYEGLFIHGSGMAFRREMLLRTDAFGSDLFWGDEEFEAALEFVSRGLRIFYLPFVVTHHRASYKNRNKSGYCRAVTRNRLLTILKYFSFLRAIEYSFKEIIYELILARGTLWSVCLGISDYLRLAPAFYKRRRVIPEGWVPYLREVRERRYPGPWRWFRNQWEGRRYRKVKVYE